MTEPLTRPHPTTGVILGEMYRDDLHGLEGRATEVYEFLHGCARVCIEYVNGDGDVKSHTFDIGQLVHVRTGERLTARRWSMRNSKPPAAADGAVAG